ncbi:MAG: sulfite exporter TauE/SafE family protein [Anaerolineae bacterium]|nr:sulfite exporter TauE/SafE family protein [Anaerolineae bacterium]MDW8171118.1 sulfite exporter TauE/SafE family protein [Anaerolineae bacterium]
MISLNAALLLTLAAFLIGLSKGGLGGPVPVAMTAPLISFALPVAQSVAIVLPLLLFADLFALYFYRNQWDMARVRLMLPAGVIGAFIGAALLATLPDGVLRLMLGVFTLLAVAYKLASDSIQKLAYQPRAWHGVLAGAASGFGSAIANLGAPPFTAYMLLQPNMTPISFIGTTTLFFAIINALKLPAFIASGVLDVSKLLELIWLFPIIPLAVWLGRRAIAVINPRAFERLMLVLLALLGLSLIFR